jgi:hypothetical protein
MRAARIPGAQARHVEAGTKLIFAAAARVATLAGAHNPTPAGLRDPAEIGWAARMSMQGEGLA